MTVKLFKTYDRKNKLNKTLSDCLTLQGDLKSGVSIVNPSITLHNTDMVFTDYNYCYIVEFKRYYYVDDVKIDTSNVYELTLSEDVLMSFNDNIEKMTVEVVRASRPNADKIDCETSGIKTLVNAIALENPFSEKGNLYLATIKGV